MTTLQIINNAKISQYLCHIDIEKRGLFGGGVDLQLPRKLCVVRKNVEWLYGKSPTHTSLVKTGNYLYALCAPYNGLALSIANGSSGGTVTPTSSNGYAYTSLGFVVTDNNVTTYQTNSLIGGKDLTFIVYNNQLLTLAANDFSVNYTTGTVTFSTVTLFTGDTLTYNFNQKI